MAAPAQRNLLLLWFTLSFALPGAVQAQGHIDTHMAHNNRHHNPRLRGMRTDHRSREGEEAGLGLSPHLRAMNHHNHHQKAAGSDDAAAGLANVGLAASELAIQAGEAPPADGSTSSTSGTQSGGVKMLRHPDDPRVIITDDEIGLPVHLTKHHRSHRMQDQLQRVGKIRPFIPVGLEHKASTGRDYYET